MSFINPLYFYSGLSIKYSNLVIFRHTLCIPLRGNSVGFFAYKFIMDWNCLTNGVSWKLTLRIPHDKWAQWIT